MSRNRLDLDSALDELKSLRPGEARRTRSLDRVLTPRRSPKMVPGLAAGATVLVVVAYLLASRTNSPAWAKVLDRTQQAGNLHITVFDASHKVVGEQWRSGIMRATWSRNESGRILSESRSDLSNFYFYVYRKQLTEPNAVQYGTLWNQTPTTLANERHFAGRPQTIDALVKLGMGSVVKQEKAEFEGKSVERYTLQLRGQSQFTVDADPSDSRILAIHIRGGGMEVFDYPASIDPKLFSYKSRLTRDIALLDLRGKEDPKHLPPFMPPVIARQKGVELRSVLIGEEGDLFVFWTGYMPSNRTANHPQILGTKTGVVRYFDYDKDGIHPAGKLICFRITALEKIGDRVTVRIPTATSFAEFKNVHVEKLHPLAE